MKNLLTLKNGLIVFSIIFLAAQLIRIDKINYTQTTSSDIFQVLDASTSVQEIIKTACYDCHSNQVKYPWYSEVAPISWWLSDHISEARSELNFSEWRKYDTKKASHKLEECFEQVARENMPLPSYTWIHRDANLTEGQRVKLVAWFKQSKRAIQADNPQ
ncbi:MAG: putative membrane protein [Cyclobacteriaceae bacterium]|jgi:uncharacterized membrane protein